MDKEYRVLVITQDNGCQAQSDGYSTSGMYDKPEEYYPAVLDGGWVVDQRTVPSKELVAAVMQAPLVDLQLEPNAVDSLKESTIVESWMCQAMMSEPGNGFGQILKHELGDSQARPKRRFGSLDKVGIALYLEYWAERGARIGRVNDGQVEWSQ
jgi:hypothetical protein